MYIAAGFLNILLKHFENVQIDICKLFLEFKTDPKVLENPLVEVDANILGKYLELIVAKENNDRIGLEAGFAIPFNIPGVIFNLYQDRAIVCDIFDNLELVDHIANNILEYTTKIEEDLFFYEIAVSEEFVEKYSVAASQWCEMQYGIALQYAHSYTGRYLYPVLAYSLYEKEGEHDELEEYLNCPIKFGKNKLSLIFNKSVLDLPVITANKDFLPIFKDFMNEIRDGNGNKLGNAVRRYLLHSLSSFSLSLESVSKMFNMSERNIQRKLKSEGTSYQLILNNLRIELSRKYLKGKIPLTEIAFLLGFESQSSFNKFFQKHFGCAPNQFK